MRANFIRMCACFSFVASENFPIAGVANCLPFIMHSVKLFPSTSVHTLPLREFVYQSTNSERSQPVWQISDNLRVHTKLTNEQLFCFRCGELSTNFVFPRPQPSDPTEWKIGRRRHAKRKCWNSSDSSVIGNRMSSLDVRMQREGRAKFIARAAYDKVWADLLTTNEK